MWLWGEEKKGLLTFCPAHYSDRKPTKNLVDRFKECDRCRSVLKSIATFTTPQRWGGHWESSRTYATYAMLCYAGFCLRLSICSDFAGSDRGVGSIHWRGDFTFVVFVLWAGNSKYYRVFSAK